ncbi:MAG: phosphohistidine phosphatase SixA [Nitrospinota bacterium]
MKLYLVRHGEALSKDVDAERGLSDSGRRDVECVASNLEKGGVFISQVLHSGKKRARQTAEILASRIAKNIDVLAAEGLNPNDPVEHHVYEARGYRQDTMLVGHLPYMDLLASRLVAGNEDMVSFNFRAGAVLCLERDTNGKWSVAWMLNPEICNG